MVNHIEKHVNKLDVKNEKKMKKSKILINVLVLCALFILIIVIGFIKKQY